MRSPAQIGALGLILATLMTACSESVPVSEPRVPDVIGRVVDVDYPETVDGGRFLGSLMLTLSDGSQLSVPRGTTYWGPRCTFIEEKGDHGAIRESVDCAINAGLSLGEVVWLMGLGIESDGSAATLQGGDLVEVDMGRRFVATRHGFTYAWRSEPDLVCDVANVGAINDPDLIEHGAVAFTFDSEGWLVGVECTFEG